MRTPSKSDLFVSDWSVLSRIEQQTAIGHERTSVSVKLNLLAAGPINSSALK